MIEKWLGQHYPVQAAPVPVPVPVETRRPKARAASK
jgi:hypothetical protein